MELKRMEYIHKALRCHENSPKQDFAEEEIDEVLFWNIDQPSLTLAKLGHYEGISLRS